MIQQRSSHKTLPVFPVHLFDFAGRHLCQHPERERHGNDCFGARGRVGALWCDVTTVREKCQFEFELTPDCPKKRVLSSLFLFWQDSFHYWASASVVGSCKQLDCENYRLSGPTLDQRTAALHVVNRRSSGLSTVSCTCLVFEQRPTLRPLNVSVRSLMLWSPKKLNLKLCDQLTSRWMRSQKLSEMKEQTSQTVSTNTRYSSR